MENSRIISPSVLSMDYSKMPEQVAQLNASPEKWLHFDVMDGHFVPNISFGYSILKDVHHVCDLFLDVHLMISEPLKYVDQFIQSGASLITFHIEAMENETQTQELIDKIKKQNVRVGISIKPMTPVSDIVKYLHDIDLILVMSVEPGFGGQSFIESSVDKIKELSLLQQHYDFLIEVDGGINDHTALLCKNAGADVLVAGSYVFHAEDRQKAIDSLK